MKTELNDWARGGVEWQEHGGNKCLFLAVASFAGSNRHARAKTGGPVVTMWCCTPCGGSDAAN